MKFSTKAGTLEALIGKVKGAEIPSLAICEYESWETKRMHTLETIAAKLGFSTPLIVRSSAKAEDGKETSSAGKYLSIPGITNPGELTDAIANVFASYQSDLKEEHVFVQRMVSNVAYSGVVFTKDPATGSPYFVINYDTSGATDGVTSGKGQDTQTLVIYKPYAARTQGPFNKLCGLLEELEQIFSSEALDVEFAIDRAGRVHLLQVRPLTGVQPCRIKPEVFNDRLREIATKVQASLERRPFLLGSRTIFGVMPDWNPAEIIGIRPRPMALSLYKELVTDSTWAYQRDNYGYRNLRSQPLIQSFHGCPFIDVRVDFNSFIPSDIPEPLAEKLVEYYLDKLACKPELHDKVEFEIIHSCYHFELSSQIQDLVNFGFTTAEIDQLSDSLRHLTTRIVNKDTGLWKKDLDRIAKLEDRHRVLMSSSMQTLDKIYWLLEDCKRYGTLPFAGLARAGFIAVQLLKSMVSTGLMSQHEYGEFLNSLNTISTKMTQDYNSLSRETFLAIYGHLRPGTYDILSARYDETPDAYFDWSQHDSHVRTHDFKLSLEQYKKIEGELLKHGLELDVLSLFDFLRSAIEGREYAKFLFTRNVSDCLSLIKRLGEEHGFSPDDLSYLNIQSLQRLYSASEDIKTTLKASIDLGREAYNVTKSILLPSLIFKPEDVFAFHQLSCEPNFVTHLSVESEVLLLDSESTDLSGKIVFIENADPGFDWIFTKRIGGFVTMYGGVNSHMAIRASEMKIPAVVGVGESNYLRWSKAKRISIDCCNRQVRVLQ